MGITKEQKGIALANAIPFFRLKIPGLSFTADLQSISPSNNYVGSSPITAGYDLSHFKATPPSPQYPLIPFHRILRRSRLSVLPAH